MLESMYISLMGIAFVILGVSLLTDKGISKIIYSALAGSLFTFLAYSSTSVQILECGSSCTIVNVFFEEMVTLFYGMATFCGILTFLFIIILAIGFKNPGSNQEGNL